MAPAIMLTVPEEVLQLLKHNVWTPTPYDAFAGPAFGSAFLCADAEASALAPGPDAPDAPTLIIRDDSVFPLPAPLPHSVVCGPVTGMILTSTWQRQYVREASESAQSATWAKITALLTSPRSRLRPQKQVGAAATQVALVPEQPLSVSSREEAELLLRDNQISHVFNAPPPITMSSDGFEDLEELSQLPTQRFRSRTTMHWTSAADRVLIADVLLRAATNWCAKVKSLEAEVSNVEWQCSSSFSTHHGGGRFLQRLLNMPPTNAVASAAREAIDEVSRGASAHATSVRENEIARNHLEQMRRVRGANRAVPLPQAKPRTSQTISDVGDQAMAPPTTEEEKVVRFIRHISPHGPCSALRIVS